jgi:cell division protease FtsH
MLYQAASSPKSSHGPIFRPPTYWQERKARMISFSVAMDLIKSNKVDSIRERSGSSSNADKFFLRLKTGELVATYPISVALFEKTAIASGVDLSYENGDIFGSVASCINLLGQTVLLILLLFVTFGVGRRYIGSPTRSLTRGLSWWQFWAKPPKRVTFSDVAGQTEAKLELAEIAEFLKDGTRFTRLGGRIPRGVLMDGPPGNGKTLLARALAYEVGVEFLHVSGSDFLEMFAGVGTRRVKAMFRKGRRFPNGCIIFIDEIDIVAAKRNQQGGGNDVQHEREQTLTQLLVEMDGIENRGKIIIIGATNRPEVLDPAILRPGRLDRRVHVPLPDLVGREEIIAIHARDVVLGADINFRTIARMTPGFSGADLENLLNESAIEAGRIGLAAIDMHCIHAARDKALMGASRPANSIDTQERRIIAIHEAGHALVATRTPHADPVHKATVLPRGRALGMVIQLPDIDRKLNTQSKLLSDLTVLMGGRAAEESIFGNGHVTSGASADIAEATRIARLMAGRLGMTREMGRMDYLSEDPQLRASAASLSRLDDVVRDMIDAAYSEAQKVVENENLGLKMLANALQESDTLTGDEVLKILDRALALGDVEVEVSALPEEEVAKAD